MNPNEGERAMADVLTCPECSKQFARAASLGAHRQRAHGVAGVKKRAPLPVSHSAARNGRAPSESVDRDRLLGILFPSGIPPRQDVLSDVSQWLDDAERLARA
jgi:hypothetical protein